MKIFNININKTNQINNKPKYQPAFRSVTREYNYDGIGQMGNYTWMFREDLNWIDLARLEIDLFKNENKVNVVQFASSDGSESYTKIISLFESGNNDDIKKFFPIEAYDINPEIVQAAKSGYINIDENELKSINEKTKNFDDYFQLSDDIFKIDGDTRRFPKKTYTIKENLKNNVIFNNGDMFKIAEEISDKIFSIVLCRNCLGYFSKAKITEFIASLSKNIKENSLLIIGYLEEYKNIGTILEENNFKKIMKNVYQKAPK